jgi:hypothetical protein
MSRCKTLSTSVEIEAEIMSDKHEAKQKKIRAKAHEGGGKMEQSFNSKDTRIDSEIRDSAGTVQEELTPFRASANHLHQG